MTKRDWVMKSTIAVMLSTSLLMGGQVGQAAAYSQDSVKSEEIVKLTKSLVGKDYKYGAEGPKSFGSAGLATYVYGQAGIKIQDTISELYSKGTKVSRTAVKPGDLVFFSSSGNGKPTFMGIYVGNDQFIYSSQSKGEVVVKKYSAYKNKFLGARSYLSAESAAKPTTPDSSKPDQDAKASALADKVIKIGEKYMGTPYKFGSSKNTTKTFDCSSFTQRVFKEAGIELPRDSRQQSTVGKTVSLKNLKKGDLIFMKASVKTSSDRITHVAIYAGNGKILHTYGKPGVTYSKFFDTNWERRVVKVKRVIPE
ncbi:C40 family peptidase [Brevibacillus composti]|uniref:C40 family peptidase n=1 Tax=Brevibacillus composti TaxID=2796470 RepID=A0A7T5JQF7_9BACL|nr:C40 family peptidase [Brevibacillus composti]QQE76423.1 C40 family peptidase [Brevibacillus composti]QUO43501.1 C40 family peptidase [Brevibacillus composti]